MLRFWKQPPSGESTLTRPGAGLFLSAPTLRWFLTVTAALLDDDTDLLEILAELLQERDCQLSARALARGAEGARSRGCWRRTWPSSTSTSGSGQPSGIDAYDWLLSQNFAGRLLFLTGHAHSHPLVARAERLNRAIVLAKPLDGDVLLDRIMGVGVGAGSGAGSHVAP